MDLEGTPAYPVNCSVFNSTQFWYLDLARGVSSAACLFICSAILFLIFLHKAYSTVLQRFLLYLTLATWVAEGALTMQIEHLVKYSGQKQFCLTVAFVDEWGGTMVIAFSFEITLLLLHRVYNSLYGHFINTDSMSRRCQITLECLAATSAVFIPLITSFEPFIRRTYGVNGGWCWIADLDKDCKGRGFWDQTALWNIPLAVLGLVIGFCIVFVMVMFCVSALRNSSSHRLSWRLVRENLLLFIFYMAFFITCAASILARVVSGITDSYAKYPEWLAYAICTPIAKLLLPLGFLVYMYSINKLVCGSCQIIRNNCCKFCRSRKLRLPLDQGINNAAAPTEGYVNVTGGPTYKSSHPIIYPSHAETVYSPAYTGAFTSITRTDISEQEERKPLISQVDTGYSSHYGSSVGNYCQ